MKFQSLSLLCIVFLLGDTTLALQQEKHARKVGSGLGTLSGLGSLIGLGSSTGHGTGTAHGSGTGTSTGTGTGTGIGGGAGSAVLEVFGQALAPQVEKLANALGDYLVKVLFAPDPHAAILGRSVVVSSNGNTASIHDISTGITIVGYGNTPEEAMTEATNKLIVTLYQGGYISKHDLHLAPVHTTTSLPCVDTFPATYCESSKRNGFCSQTGFTFVQEKCHKTCTGC